MPQSSNGLAQYSAILRMAHRYTSIEATANTVRARSFRASLVSNPLAEPVNHGAGADPKPIPVQIKPAE